MKRLLIVYHTQSGSTERLAYAAAEGAGREAGVELRLLRAMEAGARDLRWGDALLLASPENFGFLAGGMKGFLARSLYAVLAAQPQPAREVLPPDGTSGPRAPRPLRGHPAARRCPAPAGGPPSPRHPPHPFPGVRRLPTPSWPPSRR